MNNTMSYFKDNIKRLSEINLSISNPDNKMKQSNYDPVKYSKNQEIIREISFSRKISFNLLNNLNKGKNQRTNLLDKGYDNILIHSRLNSFGKISEKKLKEFIEFKDEFNQ